MVTATVESRGWNMAREPLPFRRKSWTQRVKINGQTCYLNVGEYEDGRPGEIFIDISKAGTFLRGVLGDLARAVSVALQCGAGVETAVYMLRGSDYQPSGPVEGSTSVKYAESVTDWIASELAAKYIGDSKSDGMETLDGLLSVGEGDVPIVEKELDLRTIGGGY